jgi:hypothetical protein
MGDRNVYISQKCLHSCNGLATKNVEIQWLPLTKIGFLMEGETRIGVMAADGKDKDMMRRRRRRWRRLGRAA